ncbi:MAG: DUF2237 domain-containing protein [Bacteroidota bacterium]
MNQSKTADRNVLGAPLIPCSTSPMTGFFRDGCCKTDERDQGTHTVCAVMTEEFLNYTKSKGNDLSTPLPHYGFPGLKANDRWCLCASRWKQAQEAGHAPPVILEATHEKILKFVSLEILKAHELKPKESKRPNSPISGS